MYPFGVSSSGSYRFHAFFENEAGAPSSVRSSDPFTVTPTPGAVSVPQLGTPFVVGTRVTVFVTNPSTAPYTLYYEVLASSSPAPTSAALRASTSSSSGMVNVGAGATERVSISSLAAGSYRFHALFVSGTGVPSEVASSTSFSIVPSVVPVVLSPALGVPSYLAPELVIRPPTRARLPAPYTM